MTIHNIIFSPTGGTRRVGELLCKEFGGECVTTELCTKKENLKLPGIHTDDLTVISMPVYAGRVPAMAVERLKGIEANGARCVIIAVYGNRAYEDALVEMQDVATGMGFRVVAAIAAIAEHSICRMYGSGRPDAEDANELASFAADILRKIKGDGEYAPLSCRATDHTSRAARVPTPQQTTTARAVERVRANVLPEPSLPTI